MLKEVKPKNARAARALAKREPQLVEHHKQALFLRSTSSSALLNSISQNLYCLKKPDALRFTKKNTIHPFEDPSSLEFFSQKNDASLLCFSSHSKKRPHCLTFARCFDHRILDMLECTVDPATARTLDQFGGRKWRVGTKPMLCFSGPQFEPGGSSDPGNRFVLAKSLFLDFFRGEEVTELGLEGLELLISFAAAENGEGSDARADTIYMRVWRLVTKRSGQKLPRVELEEVGPRLDFRLGRSREADPALLKEALKRDKTAKPKPKKNVDVDPIGDKIGRLHVGKQNLSELQTRKMKGLKRAGDDAAAGGLQEVVDEAGEIPVRNKKRKKTLAEV